MKDRIIQFLKDNNLTSTKFADVIDVQRSSISHILSGRNKPSFDFIEKMLLAYPSLNAQWLITGKGNMYTNQASLFNENEEKVTKPLTQRDLFIQDENNTETEINKSEKVIVNSNFQQSNHKISKEIENIMILYTDGTFKNYKPE